MLVGGSLLGTLLTAAGLGAAYLALATPVTSRLSGSTFPGSGPGPAQVGIGIWALLLIAGAALLLAGTSRLAVTLARFKAGDGRHGPGARALASMADEVLLVADVVPNEGRPIPELAIGPFGAAVIHALPPARELRIVGTSWERRVRDGWVPTESPLDVAIRDAERVRRWISMADLDFVVRVYAALIVTDQALPRSPACAVVTSDQLTGWVAALPRQRSLTTARRLRVRALAAISASSASPQSAAGGW
jgi:hypothetical protein